MVQIRSYHTPDVHMLVASKTIAENFKRLILELGSVRTDWTSQYAESLITRINDALHSNLGIDSKKDLRSATTIVASLQLPAKRDISFFKIQIDEDFKKDPTKKIEILKTLGFAEFLRGVQKGDQESLIQFLYAFKTNMTAELKAEITAKGLNPELIDNITGYADTFTDADVAQESFKGTTKEITQEVIDVFNAIYDEIIGICKKASKYYQYEPLKKEQFTFAKVLSNLGHAPKPLVTEVPTP